MRYLLQAVIIAAVTFAAELIKYFVPLPVPASIYGLLLLFALLKSGLLKLEQIEDVGNLLLELMPLPVLVMVFIGTTAVMLVTGLLSQWIIRRKGEKSHE